LTRGRFEELNINLSKKIIGPGGKVMDDADVSKSEVDKIIPVERCTRILKVNCLISDYFGGKEHWKGW